MTNGEQFEKCQEVATALVRETRGTASMASHGFAVRAKQQPRVWCPRQLEPAHLDMKPKPQSSHAYGVVGRTIHSSPSRHRGARTSEKDVSHTLLDGYLDEAKTDISSL
jgi:hypothetical protein